MNIPGFRLRLRKDLGSRDPCYTREQVEEYLSSGKARVQDSMTEAKFILDVTRNDKIMAVLEPTRERP